VANTIAALRNELAYEKQAREEHKNDVETLSRAVEELKKMADQLSACVPSLEAQVKTLNGTIVDLNTELRARELSLELGYVLLSLSPESIICILLTPRLFCRNRTKVACLKGNGQKRIGQFLP
jgi:septal ring factor EnvC (AmiA/AmiB activator)